jgi:hypothetical protein
MTEPSRLPNESDIAYWNRTGVRPPLRKQPGTPFDPARAIDISVPPKPKPPMFGWVGPFPSRPCDNCGNGEFTAGDWNMGYRCTECMTVFGTPIEWTY